MTPAGLLHRLVLCAALCLTVLPVAAAPVGVDAASVSVALAAHADVLEDVDARLTAAEVAAPERAAAFRPVGVADGEINFGYSASAYWLRFTVAPQPGAPRDWLLEVAFPSLDRVELHGSGVAHVAGDLMPFAARPLADRNFVFPLHLADAPQTFYLRVASAGTLTVPLTLWQPDAFHRYSRNAYVVLALYFGVLLALALYNLMLYFSIGDRSYLTYVLFALSMAVGQLSQNGLGNQYFWPDWPAWGNVAFPSGFAATGFFGALFTRSFLGTRRVVPGLDGVIVALAVLFAACALAPAVLSYRFAAIATSLTGVSFSLVAVVASVRCLSRGQAGARWFLLAWTLLLAGVAILGMRNMSWLPTTFFTTHAMQIGSALEMLLLSFALADRINALRHEKDAALSQALAARQETVDTLRRSEQELEGHVAARTEQLRAAEERAQRSEARYRLITDNAMDVIWLYDLSSNKFVYVSPSVEKLRGITPQEAMAQGLDDALAPASAAAAKESLAHLMADGRLSQDIWEFEQPTRDGSLLRTESRVSVICDDAGRPQEIVGITRDVTDKYKAQQEQRQFVATMSHEFRTPLAIIDAAAQVLVMRAGAVDAETRIRYDRIQRAVERLRALLDDYLDEERFNSLRQGLNLRPASLRALLDDAVAAAQALSEHHTWRVDGDGLPPLFVCDPDHLRLALRTLADNAVKYAPENSTVTLSGRSLDDGGVEIAVADEGVGIPADELPRIFDKYFRGRAAFRHPGTGLGLSLARHLVELHGGTLTAASAEGAGTVFRVRLPARSAPAAAANTRA